MSSIFRRFSSSARLGDLLVQAGILTPNQLQEAVRNSRSKKLQIGQVLVMSGFMTPKDLQIVLEAQSMVRDKTIDVNLAIQCIKVARKIGATFSDVLEDYDAAAAQRARTGKLGELLTEAGLVDAEQLSATMERSINTGMPLGRMLVLNKVMSSELLQKALDIQVRLRDEIITREEAIEQLRAAAGLDGAAAADAPPPEKKKPVVRLGELLVMSGILTEADVMDALEWGLANQQPIGNVLVSQEMISKELLDAALFIQGAVRDNKVNEMQACECLSEVFSQGISPEEALEEVIPKLPKAVPETVPITYQDLITLSRVVSEEDIESAFDVQAQTAALIGKVLVLAGYMNVPTLQATLRCYQMVAKGYLSPEDAVATLDYCLHQNPDAPLTFEQALRDLKWNPDSGLQLRTERKPDKPTTSGTRFVGAGSKSGTNAEADAEPTSGDGEELAPAAEGSDTTPGDTTDEPEPQPKSSKKSKAAEAANSEDNEGSAEKPQSKSSEKSSAKEPAEAKAESKKSADEKQAAGNGTSRKSAREPKEPVEGDELSESHVAGFDGASVTGPLTAISDLEPELNERASEPEAAAVKTAPRKRNAFAEQLEGDEPEPGGNDTGHGASNNENNDKAKSGSSSKEEPAVSEPTSKESAGKESGKESGKDSASKEASAPEAKGTKDDTSAAKSEEDEELEGGNLKSLLKGLISPAATGALGKETEPTTKSKEAEELKDITDLSAEELLVQIMTTANNPEVAVKASKKGGRFSETILPEDAKARQLAKLVGKESSKELADKLAFDKGEDDPDNVGTAFQRLAETYFDQGNYKEAQVIYERMLVHRMNDLGPDNPALVEDYNNLAMTLCVQGLFDKAEPFMKRAVHLYETLPPTDIAEYADYLHSLGTIQFKLSQFKESEETLLKVLNMRRELLPDDHEDIGRAMADYAKALKKLGKHDKAETIYKKARAILKKQP